MEMTENELKDSEIGYPIFLPKSEHAVEKAAFCDRFWQKRLAKQSNPKGIGQLMKAGGVLMNVAGAAAGVNLEQDFLDKNLVKVINGKNKSSQTRQKVLQYIKETAVQDLQIKKFYRQENLDIPEDSKIKSIDTHYYIFHLAVLYNSKEVLEIFYEAMKSNKESCQTALDLRVETSIIPLQRITEDSPLPEKDNSKDSNLEGVDISANFFKLRDEVCAPSALFLAVKYNAEALQQLVKIADSHGIMDDILSNQRDFRDFNLLQFATKNASIQSLR